MPGGGGWEEAAEALVKPVKAAQGLGGSIFVGEAWLPGVRDVQSLVFSRMVA